MAARNYKFLVGDINWADHGGKFIAKGDWENERYIMDIVRCDEYQEDPDHTYRVEVSSVELREANTPLQSALRCHGYYIDSDDGCMVADNGDEIAKPNTKEFDLMCFEVLHGYGHRNPVCELFGNNIKKLMQDARSF